MVRLALCSSAAARAAAVPRLGWTRLGLVEFLVVKLTKLQAVIFGGQNSIEFFDESEEFGPVFFYRN